MKLLKYLSLIILALLLTFADASFFSSLSFRNASIVSTLSLVLIFAFLGNSRIFFIFTFSVVIFFSVFSSIPIWLIFLIFFIMPSIFLFLRKSHLPIPSIPFSIVFFVLADFLFELSLLLTSGEWNSAAIKVLLWFVLLNVVFGTVIYYVIRTLGKKPYLGR